MKSKVEKRIFAAIVAFAVAISGFIYVPEKEALAAEEDVVRYQTVSYTIFEDCITNKKAPECELSNASDNNQGYLFAGWYTKEGAVIKSVSEVKQGATNITAKFVAAHLAGVACQVRADIKNEGVEKTNLRIVSAVDSANYAAVGFNIYGRHDNDKDGVYTEWLMYRYDAASKAESKKVYTGLQVYKADAEGKLVADGTPKTPADVFGPEAEGFYFTTMSLNGIPKASYGTTVVIKPYWITLDGTVVEGLGEFNRVQDSMDGIVNVSVNLKDVTDIAAGMLNIKYDEQNFVYQEAECGRVFEEMDFAQDGNTIKCIGNVSTVKNAAEPNDIYVNLRFVKTDANDLQLGQAEFTVEVLKEGFCDINEKIVDVTAWDVKY